MPAAASSLIGHEKVAEPAPTVMAGLDPAIHPSKTLHFLSWMAASSAAMTNEFLYGGQ